MPFSSDPSSTFTRHSDALHAVISTRARSTLKSASESPVARYICNRSPRAKLHRCPGAGYSTLTYVLVMSGIPPKTKPCQEFSVRIPELPHKLGLKLDGSGKTSWNWQELHVFPERGGSAVWPLQKCVNDVIDGAGGIFR